jgi:hypothetical protein
MKKKFVLFVVLISVVFAKDISELEQYAPFLAGKYRVIGQDIDTNATYSGVITLEYSDDKLIVKRVIDDKIQNGIAIIQKPFIESPKILEVSYTKSNQIVKTYYIWQTEFDNYARLTGRIMRDNKQVGYEALFAIKF